eukprot:RCo005214
MDLRMAWVTVLAAGVLLLQSCPSAGAVKLRGSVSALVEPLVSSGHVDFSAVFPETRFEISVATSMGTVAALDNNTADFAMPSINLVLPQPDMMLFPFAITPMVNAFNLPNVTDAVVLSREVLASIWAGNVTRWSDPAIKALNEGVTLPNKTIILIVREGNTGYTLAQSMILCSFSAAWNVTMHSFSEASGFTHGNSAATIQNYTGDGLKMAAMIKETPYSMGFVPLFDAIDHQVSFNP